MLNLRNAVVGLGLVATATMAAGAAAAAPAHGYVTTSLNLRAGPGTDYPVVSTMGAGDAVTIYGCLSGYAWCDISWDGYRGWAAGQYLQVIYRQHRQPILGYGHYLSVPFLSFSIGSYWQDHYRNRRFFGDMQRYRGHHDDNPPNNGHPPGPPSNVTLPPNTPPPPHNHKPHGSTSPNMYPPPHGTQFNGRNSNGPPPKHHCPPGKRWVNGACH